MRGMGGVFKRGPVWWIRHGRRGRKYRESSKSPDRAVAFALLKQRSVTGIGGFSAQHGFHSAVWRSRRTRWR